VVQVASDGAAPAGTGLASGSALAGQVRSWAVSMLAAAAVLAAASSLLNLVLCGQVQAGTGMMVPRPKQGHPVAVSSGMFTVWCGGATLRKRRL
jgi:hypothetical protein